MKKIILFDPSCGTRNNGDYIISSSIMKEMDFLFSGSFLIKYSTHTPITHFYQLLHPNLVLKSCRDSDYKFLCGSNLLKKNMFHLSPDFNIHFSDSVYYNNSICIGVGMDDETLKPTLYSKLLFKKILSNDFIHSVRDEEAKEFLESIGKKAVNTGCPTLWKLTDDFCKNIPINKAKNVIFTITDYCKNFDKDKQFVEILKKNYENLFFWIQGDDDLNYLKQLTDISDINFINPSLEYYKDFLINNDVDYIGTRLHAGIFAMQNLKRTIIVMIDNRAREMKKSYNLNTIDRDNIDKLDEIINQEIKTNIKINENEIIFWKSQFKGDNHE